MENTNENDFAMGNLKTFEDLYVALGNLTFDQRANHDLTLFKDDETFKVVIDLEKSSDENDVLDPGHPYLIIR